LQQGGKSAVKWFWILIAVIYLASPLDIIPGLHPAGWIDDIIVLILLCRYLVQLGKSDTAGRPPRGDNTHRQQQSRTGAGQSETRQEQSPFDVLGVSPGVDQDEIHAAYRKLANQYHPDKVAHLGDEFRTMAEKRFKEIQSAYDKLSR
jgi:hypothetical protein